MPLYSVASNGSTFYHRPPHKYNSVDLVDYGWNAVNSADSNQDPSFDTISCGDSISMHVSILFDVKVQCLEFCQYSVIKFCPS